VDNVIEKSEVEMIEQFVELRDHKVLEIGCGEGRISEMLANRTQKLIAIDPDEQSIKKAKSEFPEVDFRIGTGETLAFEDSSIPIILFTFSLHHQDSQLALKEAHRVLSRDGRVIIIEPTADGELTQFYSLFDDETERLQETLKIIEACEFTIEHKETFLTTTSFNNRDELIDYPFAREKIHLDDRERIIRKLNQLRGPVKHDQAITLKDDCYVFSLRKKR
jgi:ubiquinone/menaquinone biosynthesis C-methylase UbiE